MNDSPAKTMAMVNQSQGELRTANGDCCGPLFSRVSVANSGEEPAASWRPTWLVASGGVGDWADRSALVPGVALGALTLNSEGAPVDASSATPLGPGALRVFGAGAAAGAAAPPALVPAARGNDESTADARNKKIAAPLAKVEKVRRGASQKGTEMRGTSERDGTGIGSAAMRRAVPRSSARRVRQGAHVSRCACTAAEASGESAPSRYAERSPNGCTVLASYP